jgi:hypothetical protein
MAITTAAQLLAAMRQDGKKVKYFKISSAGSAPTGQFVALFYLTGTPAPGTAPSTASGQALSRLSPGALVSPPPSGVTYLTRWVGGGNGTGGAIILADRLVETGGLSGIVTTAQTVNSVALPARAGSGDGVELWLEIYTTLGVTASPTVTALYTNQAGVSGRTATLQGGLPTPATARKTFPLTLQAGDTGVQSVQSVTSTTSTGTAGAFGVVLRRQLCMVFTDAYVGAYDKRYAETGLQIIPDDACLELIFMNTSVNSSSVQGFLQMVQG